MELAVSRLAAAAESSIRQLDDFGPMAFEATDEPVADRQYDDDTDVLLAKALCQFQEANVLMAACWVAWRRIRLASSRLSRQRPSWFGWRRSRACR